MCCGLCEGWERISRHGVFQKGACLLSTNIRDNVGTASSQADFLTDQGAPAKGRLEKGKGINSRQAQRRAHAFLGLNLGERRSVVSDSFQPHGL